MLSCSQLNRLDVNFLERSFDEEEVIVSFLVYSGDEVLDLMVLLWPSSCKVGRL